MYSVSVDISAGMPKFLGQLQNVTVSEGRDATFTCSVTNLGGHKVAWIKSDTKAILAIHYHVITNNDNLQVCIIFYPLYQTVFTFYGTINLGNA